MKNIATGVLILAGLYFIYLVLQLMVWTLISVQVYIPWVVCGVLAGYCFRKVLIYKKAIRNDNRIG